MFETSDRYVTPTGNTSTAPPPWLPPAAARRGGRQWSSTRKPCEPATGLQAAFALVEELGSPPTTSVIEEYPAVEDPDARPHRSTFACSPPTAISG